MNTPKTAIFLPTKPLDLLLDFVNMKAWSKEGLRHLQMKHGMAASRGGQERGYDDSIYLQHLEGHYLLEDAPLPYWRGVKIAQEDVFFDALVGLQNEWRNRLESTREHGPDIVFLNEIAAPAKWMVIRTANPFAPRVGPFGFHPGPLDKFLEFRFLDAVLTQGDDLKRLRICENPACGKMFVQSRKDKVYCVDKCRLDFHNKKNTESGYHREYQRKGRLENPDVYLTKDLYPHP